MGTAHAVYLYKGEVENAVLGEICDNKPAKLEKAKEKYVYITLFSDYKDMIKSGNVDFR